MDVTQRISYVPYDEMTPEMQAEMDRCAREERRGPRARLCAHVLPAFWFFANAWNDLFREDRRPQVEGACRVYVSRSVKCEYCGNQRSEKGREGGLVEGQVRRAAQLRVVGHLHRAREGRASPTRRPSSGRATPTMRLGSGYTSTSRSPNSSSWAAWSVSRSASSRGCDLGIDHHQVMPGTDASMAPGFETAEALAETKGSERYWAAST